MVNDLTGGVARYKPVNPQSFGPHILCSASVRAENAAMYFDSHPDSALEDLSHVRVLLRQLGEVQPEGLSSDISDFYDSMGSIDGIAAKQLAIEPGSACESARADSTNRMITASLL